MHSEEEDACVALARGLGYDVKVFSVPERAQVPDTPDTYLRHVGHRVRIWWEVKRFVDKLSERQHQFLMTELAAGGIAGTGDRADLQSVLVLCARNVMLEAARRRCAELVSLKAARGYRPERGRRARR